MSSMSTVMIERVRPKGWAGAGRTSRTPTREEPPRSSEAPIPTPWHDLSQLQRESAEAQGWGRVSGINHRWLIDLHGRVIGRGLAEEVLQAYFARKQAADH